LKKRVILLKCESYNEDFIYERLKRAIDLFEFKNIPEKILIKPNMLSARKPEEGVTSHPCIISSLIRIFKDKKLKLEILSGQLNSDYHLKFLI